ncbi:DUF2510 domain-containing protein [Tsukamurella asaccharolytica]|uniref:DUF2510 domain-containing protein n=1 Tax=Tsukamurella asaccharolytica TaxID=2592067 RepID=A0A5C5R5V9_9ACTN|nr:DUF2510 domain-containing protein [Tsukamurella asaccharolytica]TWS18587.1 DUF2510 domain-containing protein [Tsukamurella asaccharolytica]
MSTPTPPPGWHPDPAGSSRFRWWDGTMWTEQYADSADAAPPSAAGASATPPSVEKPISRGKKIALGVGGALVVLILLTLVVPKDEKPTNAASETTTTAAASAPATTATAQAAPSAAPATSTTATTSARRSTKPKPAGCEAVPENYLSLINASFKNGYQLINSSAYTAGGTLYIAGEIAKADGRIRSRDDVFAVKGGVLSAITATARNESNLPDARKVQDLSVLDEGAVKAQDCARTY